MMVTYVHHNNRGARRLIDHRGSRGQDGGWLLVGGWVGGGVWVVIINVYVIYYYYYKNIIIVRGWLSMAWLVLEVREGGAVQRDRSSSVQIFSQRFDDFYILFIIMLGGRIRHVVPIYTIYYIIIIQRIISSTHAIVYNNIIKVPAGGGTRGDCHAAAARRRRLRRRLPWGKPAPLPRTLL